MSCQCHSHEEEKQKNIESSCGCGCGSHEDESHSCGCEGEHEKSHNHSCNCKHSICPRAYHAIAGLILCGMLTLHFIITLLGFFPEKYQQVISWIHHHANILIAAEILFIGVPLLVHIGFGLRFLMREGLRFQIEKHHCGSLHRYWWQRITAVVLLAFLVFHIGTLHRWGFHLAWQITHFPIFQRYEAGGLLISDQAYTSTVQGIGLFWNAQNPWHIGNLAVVGFYFIGVLAACYHSANGISNAAEVLHWTKSRCEERKLWKACVVAGIILALIGGAALFTFTLGA